MTVDLSVDISGTNIGCIHLFVGYFDANANSLNVTDRFSRKPQHA